MPQINVGTSNITTFGFSVTFDILNRAIKFNILPFTSGPGLGNTKVAFSVADSAGVVLASIDFNNPQIPNPATTTQYTLDLSDSPYAFLFSSFSIVGAIQDQSGQVYQTTPLVKTVCMPNDFQESGSVPGMFTVTPDCSANTITVKEVTIQVYNALKPITVTKSGTLYYPVGTVAQVDFASTPFTNNQVWTGQSRLKCTTYATYDLGSDFYVVVGYVTDQVFDITCTSKMANLLCCIREVQQTAIRNCDNAIGENARQLLADVTVPFVAGMLAEIRGMDASAEVAIVKKKLNCNCGSNAIGQNEVDPVNPAVNTIVISGSGGTNVSSTTVGNTKNFVVNSDVYQVTKGNPADPAFTIGFDDSVPNLIKYPITFNYLAMAQAIYTATAGDPATLAQLNALVNSLGLSLTGLDGKCIIDMTKTTYTVSLAVTGATLVQSIFINGVSIAAPANLFATDTVGVQNWLNSLSLGTWNVSINAGTVTIISIDNTNSVSTITFGSPDLVLQFGRTTNTLLQVLQALINYICSITAVQIAIGQAMNICTIDYNGVVVITPYQSDTKQSDFNQAMADATCNLANRIAAITAVTCAKIQSIFQDNPNASFNYASDRFLAIVSGACTSITAKQAVFGLIAAINADQATKDAFCAIDCSVPGTCPDVSNINSAAITTTSIGLYGITWNVNPSSNQTVSVKYRITGSSVFTTAASALQVFPNGNLVGSSPFIISGLTPNQSYDIFVQNTCGGNGFTKQVSTPASTVYSGTFLLGNVLYLLCSGSPVTLYSQLPFAPGVTMYLDNLFTMPAVGYSYISSVSSGHVFTMNNLNAVVGVDTGNICTSGTSGFYTLGNNIGTVCSGVQQTLYTNGAFAPGKVLYVDSALTTPATGYSYVVQNSTLGIYNLNSGTALVGSATGTSCNLTVIVQSALSFLNISAVNGITGFTFTPGPGPFNQTGPHSAFSGSISVSFNGTVPPSPPFSMRLFKNGIQVSCIPFPTGFNNTTFAFPSDNYLITDFIKIDIGTGGC